VQQKLESGRRSGDVVLDDGIERRRFFIDDFVDRIRSVRIDGGRVIDKPDL
jgi:hypothetical protein